MVKFFDLRGSFSAEQEKFCFSKAHYSIFLAPRVSSAYATYNLTEVIQLVQEPSVVPQWSWLAKETVNQLLAGVDLRGYLSSAV